MNVLREACRVLRRELLQIGNIYVFLESVTIASACIKLIPKRLFKFYTIGLTSHAGTLVK